MSGLLRTAEEILEVAARSDESVRGQFLVVDTNGALRIVESEGWSLAGLIAELGARQVFRVERFRDTVRVEAWSQSERCAIQRQRPALRRVAPCLYPTTLQLLPQPTA